MAHHRPNFRVKVDLTKYHRDVRRFSWIFVDTANCRLVAHIKQHIVNIFRIEEPFNLLLNGNEYLPPMEDVRVLKENETIAVVPELAPNDADDFQSPISLTLVRDDDDDGSADVELRNVAETNERNENCHAGSVDDFSNTDRIARSVSDVTGIGSVSDSRDTATENSGMLDIGEKRLRKRKRTRRKKSTKEPEATVLEDDVDKSPTRARGPKILQCYVLPAGKHIRFDNGNVDECTVIENTSDNTSSKKNGKPDRGSDRRVTRDSVSTGDLSTLLALKKSSVPLTFGAKKTNQRIDNAVTTERIEELYGAPNPSGSSTRIPGMTNEASNGSSDAIEPTRKQIHHSQLNFDEYPILESPPELNDTIVFKILRIGKDYSPEISDNIVAKTRSWCPKKLLFTFEILQGQEQIQTPMGKFSLPENDFEHQEIETANFNFSQLIEPRLMYRQLNTGL